MANITIYSTPTCMYCKMAKQFFDENDVDYTDIDVSQDQQAQKEMIEKSQQMGVPVIDIDGEIHVGFNKKEIAKALGVEA